MDCGIKECRMNSLYCQGRTGDMHELGIAGNILDIVRQAVPEGKAGAVRKIRIRVGALSGVVPDSLLFCLEALLNGSEMRHAGPVMENVPAVADCRVCRKRFTMEDFAFSCPFCSSGDLDLISGRELEVVDIELSED